MTLRFLPALLTLALCAAVWSQSASTAQSDAPIVVVETLRGTFAFQTFPNEAPVSVKHVTTLVGRGFYDGQRIHRAVAGFVVQFGDPRTRDLEQRAVWGRGADAGSGTAVGVAEMSSKRIHQTGSVGLAHMGDPLRADSQIYITLTPRRDLDGRYTVVGQVIEGEEVLSRLQVGDEITRVSLRP
jgi:cyclophilin family peptidyl-prolyl cis-trans isomerase